MPGGPPPPPPRRLYIDRCITKGMRERKMVVPKSLELFEAEYLILTNFFAYLISQIFSSRISRVLIFAILSLFSSYPEQRTLVTNQWGIYISKQNCKLTTALHRIMNNIQITGRCVYCLRNVYHTVQCLKRNMRCSVNVHGSKYTRTQKIFKILIVFFRKWY